MNILVVCHYLGDNAPATIYIHDQMKAFVQLGHRVRCAVLLPWGKQGYQMGRFSRGKALELDGIEYQYVRCLSLSNYGDKNGWNARFAAGAMRRARQRVVGDMPVDVIHAHTLGVSSEAAACLKAQLLRPVVVTTHGSDSSVPIENKQYTRMEALCRSADRIVSVSSNLGRKLRQCGTTTPISTILNGFALQHLPAAAEKTPLTFLQVGSLLAQKRTDITIQAFGRIYDAYPDAHLTIIGQGEEEENLKELCAELGIAHAVTFRGQLPNSEVLAEMAKTAFFVMPSVREGFGIVYLEAMACGCITIGTKGEGIADLIRDGENGFLVPADDPDAIVSAVKRCLRSETLSADVAARGAESARRLTWLKNAQAYLELFSSLQ